MAVFDGLHNVEAEQNLLGAILVNNDVLARVSGIVRAGDFYDPVHGRIFEVCAQKIADGQDASPVTVRMAFEGDDGLKALGGPAYLVRLAGAAITLFAAPDYARIIARLARKREVAAALEDARADLLRDDKDAEAVLGGLAAIQIGSDSGGNVIPFAAAIVDAMGEAQAAYERGSLPGITTGLDALDRETGGWMPGDYIILGGRPSMGKTSIATSMALAAARAGHGVAFCSLEMTAPSLGIRAISEATARDGWGVAYRDARCGSINETDIAPLQRAAQAVGALPIALTPPSCRDVGSIYAAVHRIKGRMEAKGTPLGLIVVDYLQLVRSARERTVRREEIDEISGAMKGMALKFNVPVLALSQLSRNPDGREGHRPQLSDLRESGSLEQDADTVIFCFRDEYYLRRDKPQNNPEKEAAWSAALAACAGKVDLIIAKQRMGSLATLRFDFDERTNFIRDLGA